MNFDQSKAISTIYPTKDWVISNFIVTDYGAQAAPGFDNREAFQKAINAAYAAGGAVVFIPAGNYEFRSTKSNTVNVRTRKQDGSETNDDFSYEYVLTLPPGVQLRGDFPGSIIAGGTILEVHAGKDSLNYDRKIESWWNDSQDNNTLHTSYTSIARKNSFRNILWRYY